MGKRVLILGVGGQDGSILAGILIRRQCEVHGLQRRSSVDNLRRVRKFVDDGTLTLHRGDVTDDSLGDVIRSVRPDEVYNCADQDNVGWSYADPLWSAEVTYKAVVRMLEAVRLLGNDAKIYQPLSATVFGDAEPPQNENTEMRPLSPYACAKTAVRYLCDYYFRIHSMRILKVILYNHDSPERNPECLLHHVCRRAVEISLGRADTMPLSCPGIRVDVGCAHEYMDIVADLMNGHVGTYVLGYGDTRTVRHLALTAMEAAGLAGDLDSKIVDATCKRLDSYANVRLVADNSKLRAAIGRVPKMTAETLVHRIVWHYQRELTK